MNRRNFSQLGPYPALLHSPPLAQQHVIVKVRDNPNDPFEQDSEPEECTGDLFNLTEKYCRNSSRKWFKRA